MCERVIYTIKVDWAIFVVLVNSQTIKKREREREGRGEMYAITHCMGYSTFE